MNPFREKHRETGYLKPFLSGHIQGIQIQRKIMGRFLPFIEKDLRENIGLCVDIIQFLM